MGDRNGDSREVSAILGAITPRIPILHFKESALAHQSENPRDTVRADFLLADPLRRYVRSSLVHNATASLERHLVARTVPVAQRPVQADESAGRGDRGTFLGPHHATYRRARTDGGERAAAKDDDHVASYCRHHCSMRGSTSRSARATSSGKSISVHGMPSTRSKPTTTRSSSSG